MFLFLDNNNNNNNNNNNIIIIMKAIYAVVLFAALGAVAMADQTNDAKCPICKTVITLVDNWLDEGKTHEQIKKLVTQLCSYVGPSYADICSALLDGELEQVIKYIETMEPKQVCQKIKMCPVEISANGMMCSVCKYVIDALENFVQDPHTEQQVVNFLDRLCKMFPKYEAVCDQLVAYGIKELIALIKQKGDSSVVCKTVKLC